mgnify:CR=1 FL=1
MPKPARALRLFVAAYPPAETADALREACRSLDLPDHRLTPTEQIHLTVHFIGETPVNKIEEAEEKIAHAIGGLPPTTLHPVRLIRLPERGRARLIAAECEAGPSLLEVQRRLAQRFAGRVRAKPGDKYLPHLTLCRFRPPSRIEEIAHRLDLPPFEVREIRLMRSRLDPGGAVHEPVRSFAFEGPGRG